MSNGHDTYMNYMDDDTVQIGCHTCGWEGPEAFEDEEIAQVVLDDHCDAEGARRGASR